MRSLQVSLIFVAAAAANDDGAIRINAGVNFESTDSDGVIWQPDQYFSGGEAYGNPDTPWYYAFQGQEYYRRWSKLADEARRRCDESVYCRERFFRGGGSYEIPVTGNGPYLINLHFTEKYVFLLSCRLSCLNLDSIPVPRGLQVIVSLMSTLRAYSARKTSTWPQWAGLL